MRSPASHLLRPYFVTADFDKPAARHQTEIKNRLVFCGQENSEGAMRGSAFDLNPPLLTMLFKSIAQSAAWRSLAGLVGVLLAGVAISFAAAALKDEARAGQILIGGPENERISGGPGVDMAVFSGSRWSYVIFRIEDQVVIIGPDGEDRLTDVEVLHFDDMTLNLGAALSRTLSNGLLHSIPLWRVGS
jgi:hypothetical protein